MDKTKQILNYKFIYFKMPILCVAVLLLCYLAPVFSQTISLVSTQNITSGDEANFQKVATVDFTDDGSLLLIAIDDELQIWSVNSSSQYTQVFNISASDGLEEVYFNSNYSTIAGTGRSNTFIYYWDSATGYNYIPAQIVDNGSPPLSLSWNSNGNYTIVGSTDTGIRVYNYTNGMWAIMQNLTGHTGPVIALKAQKSRIASVALGDNLLRIWYYNTTMGLYYQVETEALNQVNSSAIDYSADEKWIAVGHTNGVIQIFSRNITYNYSKTQTLDSTVGGHTNLIFNLRFSLDGSMLASVSVDNTTKLWLWNSSTGNWSISNINTFPIPGYSVDFNQFYQVAVGWLNSSFGNVSLLDVQPLNCSSDPNSNGSTTSDGSECVCNSGYYWRFESCFYLNCANVNNSNGNKSSVSSCVCNTGFLWDPYTLMCIINCALKNNSIGLNYEFSSCYCSSGYNWDGNNCSAYINCNGLQNGNGSNIDANNCFCNSGYYFNSTAVACYIDCSNVNFSSGYNPSNTSACNCNGGYFWNDSYNPNTTNVAACERDCSALNFTDGNDDDNPDYCNCQDSFDWDPNIAECIVNCGRVKFSTGEKYNDRNRCHCQDEYWWDHVTQQCLPHTGSVKGAAIACGIAIPLSILALLLAYKLYVYYRKHKIRKPPKVIPVYVQPVLNMSQNVVTPPVPQLGQLATQPTVSSPSPFRSSGITSTIPVPAPVIVGQPPMVNGPRILGPPPMGPSVISPRPINSTITNGPSISSVSRSSRVDLLPPPNSFVGGPPASRPPANINTVPPPRYTGMPMNGVNPNQFTNEYTRYNQPPINPQAYRRTRQEENVVSGSMVRLDPFGNARIDQ